MQQEFTDNYYMVINEQSEGPFTLEQVKSHPALTPETLVWKPGIENWVAAKTLPEISSVFFTQQQQEFNTPPNYNSNQQREQSGYSPNTGQYQNPPFAENPQYNTHHSYHQQRHYQEPDPYYANRYDRPMRTNWLPWAIVATILGFLTSCIGAIFGIIGIVQANKANNFYSRGLDREGDAANSNAKIMTIIGLVFAGLGIAYLVFFGSMFSSLVNLSYL